MYGYVVAIFFFFSINLLVCNESLFLVSLGDGEQSWGTPWVESPETRAFNLLPSDEDNWESGLYIFPYISNAIKVVRLPLAVGEIPCYHRA